MCLLLIFIIVVTFFFTSFGVNKIELNVDLTFYISALVKQYSDMILLDKRTVHFTILHDHLISCSVQRSWLALTVQSCSNSDIK